MFEPSPPGTTGNAVVPDWITALGAESGFLPDDRYNPAAAVDQPTPPQPDAELETEIAKAFTEGRQQGLAEAVQQANKQSSERRKLGSRLRRLDEEMVEQLGRQLSETIVVLCEATLAPLALDRDLLAQRCTKAAQLLGESGSERVLRLSPDDVAALDKEFRESWNISPDPELLRGSLRIEGLEGGISDGPVQWRAALVETLGLECG